MITLSNAERREKTVSIQVDRIWKCFTCIAIFIASEEDRVSFSHSRTQTAGMQVETMQPRRFIFHNPLACNVKFESAWSTRVQYVMKEDTNPGAEKRRQLMRIGKSGETLLSKEAFILFLCWPRIYAALRIASRVRWSRRDYNSFRIKRKRNKPRKNISQYRESPYSRISHRNPSQSLCSFITSDTVKKIEAVDSVLQLDLSSLLSLPVWLLQGDHNRTLLGQSRATNHQLEQINSQPLSVI